MLKFFFLSFSLVTALAISCSAVLASGNGHHSYDKNQIERHDNADVITYKESSDGIDAYLEFNVQIKKKSSKGFVAKCNIQVFLKKIDTGEYVKATKLALRSTDEHGKFGEAKALFPVGENRMGTDIILTEQGKYHFLIIADIPSVGSRKFHFHHTF